MKTVTLTPDEVEMIKEDIESTLEYFDLHLLNTDDPTPEEREEYVNDAATAESILRKLG